MNRDEHVGVHTACLRHAVVERHEHVLFSCHEHDDARVLLQERFGLQRDGKHNVFLVSSGRANRSGVLATVPRIKHNDEGFDVAGRGGTWRDRRRRLG